MVTVYNVSGQPIAEPIALLLVGLPRKVRLLNGNGISRRIAPGSPYVMASLPDQVLNAFGGATFRLMFWNPRGKKIRPAIELTSGLLDV
jgi:hypothetical protein